MNIERSRTPFLFFSKKEKEQIIHAIQTAEKDTSGEIRLHLARRIKGDILENAKKTFEKLGMARTEAHNGVLVFMDVKSKRFAVIGDKGIHEKVPEGFWNDIVTVMVKCFREDRFADGISEGIEMIGEKLSSYFPYQQDDVNELSDDISFSW